MTAILACGILLQAHQMRVPRVVQARMLVNIGIDLVLGAIPVAGDLFDFAWRANTKNFALLERHARAPGPPSIGDWFFVAAVLSTLILLAMIPLFVMYWIGHALGAHFSALAR